MSAIVTQFFSTLILLLVGFVCGCSGARNYPRMPASEFLVWFGTILSFGSVVNLILISIGVYS